MKRFAALLLVIVFIAGIFPAPASADGSMLQVQTRSGLYNFKVGETFRYSYWLDLAPDLINYTENTVKAGYSDLITTSLQSNALASLVSRVDPNIFADMDLKNVGGNITYDIDCLELVSAATPSLTKSYILQKQDFLAGTLLDGGFLDFTNSNLGFWTGIRADPADVRAFAETSVLITCTFRVIATSSQPVYLRTRLRHLEVTTPGTEDAEGVDLVLVHRNQSVFIPYVSYETINDEKPTYVLPSLVDDVGLDLRYIGLYGTEDSFFRPGSGAVVRMIGASIYGKEVELRTVSDGSDVVWFYDVPYGQYYVDCAFTDQNGVKYGTPDPEKAEHINVPATGEIQALWLCKLERQGDYTITIPLSEAGSAAGEAWIDGKQVSMSSSGTNLIVTTPVYGSSFLTIYRYNTGDTSDPHSRYPTGMKVWQLDYIGGSYIANYLSDFDNLLSYGGSSIRITGSKGIRMITGIKASVKKALTGSGIAGYTLMEYGTLLARSSDLNGKPLTLEEDCARHNFAYCLSAHTDPIYKKASSLVEYTNVLVGFSESQCAEDIAMRPYIVLKDSSGQLVTLYGGIVERSIGYIARQNQSSFKAGSEAYQYIQSIIDAVYGG